MSLPTTSLPLPFHPSVRSSIYKILQKRANKTSLRVAKFSLSCFSVLKGLYCNDICISRSSREQRATNVHDTHFCDIDSNTPIKKLRGASFKNEREIRSGASPV
ncbi:MAG: hypothetical protein ACLSD4_08225, partial [Bifidobacterium catenulatum]